MERILQIEALIQKIESSADPRMQTEIRELVEAILDFHAKGLGKILDLIRVAGPQGDAAMQAFAQDDLVASLLLLYGLHPEEFETRVRRAVDRTPNLVLTGLSHNVVRVRVTRPGSLSREMVEETIYAAAPETAAIEIDGLASTASFVPLEALLR